MGNKKIAAGILTVMLAVAGGAVLAARGEAQTAAAGRAGASDRPQADAPQFVNVKLDARIAGASLGGTIKEVAGGSGVTWVGYSVNPVEGMHTTCCNNGDGAYGCGTCRLEGDTTTNTRNGKDSKEMALESGVRQAVLLRVMNGKVTKVRLASSDCTVDAGGMRVVWLGGVKDADSVHYLTQLVRADNFARDDERVGRQALTAIALDGDASADEALASFVAASAPVELRKQTVFWLGEARGKAGLAELLKLEKSDPSEDVRAQIAFALSLSREPSAVDEMVRMAHEDTSSHVRGQALFWLAQKAGKKAASAITGAIDNDPDTDVKKKAVFALSQMPKDEGVPKLIEVAQTNRNPEVRKQAMFWLGQSNDPRALAFFEKVLAE
jgi:hypothetical protein